MKGLLGLWLLAGATTGILSHESFIIEADNAISSQDKLELSGHIKIQSGPLSAESGQAFCLHDKQSPLQLSQNVKLFVENYGQISCDTAFLDPAHHVAHFNSSLTPVVYADTKNGLQVKACSMTISLTENNQKMTCFDAYQNVQAEWKYNLSCDAEEAHYTPDNHTLVFQTAHILVKDKTDLICQKAAIDTKTHIIKLQSIAGTLHAKEDLHVIADQLSYKEPVMDLKGNVHLNMKLAAGMADLTSVDSCIVDDTRHTIFLLPPVSRQIILTTPYGNLRASSIDLHYEEDEGEYKLQTMILRGDVEIANTFSFKDPETPVNRYALADIVEVDCFEKVMTLKAQKNKRVLFYDEGKKVQVSADAIAVCYRDGQEEISGKGAVRMLFNDSELSRITEHFHK